MSFYDFELEYTFQDDTLAELDRQLALLMTTRVGTMPLARDFGLDLNFVDRPQAVARSLYAAEITEKIPKFIPVLRVREVRWTADPNGGAKPKVVLTHA